MMKEKFHMSCDRERFLIVFQVFVFINSFLNDSNLNKNSIKSIKINNFFHKIYIIP